MANDMLPNPDGTYAMPEAVWIPLVNLEAGAGYRGQLRDMEELENSIRQFGVLTPLWVHPDPDVRNRYVIFAGHRRHEAAKKIARERCDSSIDTPISVQVGRQLIPCRVFRDLAEIHRSLLALTENTARREPSVIDTAKEIRRIKSLLENETGRPVKPEDVIAMLSGQGVNQKPPGKRHLYRLLRIARLDPEVAAVAREQRLASDFVDQISRLPSKEEQMQLVSSIVDKHLSRNEVRDIVTKRLSDGDSDLSAAVDEVVATVRVQVGNKAFDIDVWSNDEENRRTDRSAADPDGGSLKIGQMMDVKDGSGTSIIGSLNEQETSGEITGVTGLIRYLRSRTDVDLLRSGDVLQAWAMSENRRDGSGQVELERWLAELDERKHDPAEIVKLRTLLQGRDNSRLEVELARLLYMYQGILAEHLPGYLRHIGDAMGESAWFCSVIRCFLELLSLLRQPEESKKVASPAKRALDIMFHELFWLSIVYDHKLQYHVEKLPTMRKREFLHYVLLCDHQETGSP